MAMYLTHPAGNLVGKYSFRQVHRVCNSNDNKPRIRTIGPFEKIVHNCLFFRDHQVQFIHQDNAVGSLVRISKFLFFATGSTYVVLWFAFLELNLLSNSCNACAEVTRLGRSFVLCLLRHSHNMLYAWFGSVTFIPLISTKSNGGSSW